MKNREEERTKRHKKKLGSRKTKKRWQVQSAEKGKHMTQKNERKKVENKEKSDAGGKTKKRKGR